MSDSSRSSAHIPDWPAEGIGLEECHIDSKESDQICEECNGTRSDVVRVFRMTISRVKIGDTVLTWSEFRLRHPETAAAMEDGLELGTFSNPTCLACAEDMRMRMKKLLNE